MPAVLHVSETLLGGVGAVVADLARAQAAAGWRVAVAAPPDERSAQLRPGGVTVHAWAPGARPGPHLPAQLRELRRVVAAERPELVHLHSSMAGLCGRLVVRRRIPTLFQPHSWSFFAVDEPVRTAAVAWERAGARWADVVLCVSEDEREHARRAGVRARTEVIANGVDLERFSFADDAARTAARRALGLGDEPLVVCSGRLHRQKGQQRLLDAWPAVRRAVPGAVLALVGDGPDRAALAARGVEGVGLVGQVEHVERWLAAADLVAMPSTWEGMSLSLLEARALGRAVVVTDVPGMREVVTPGSGAVVPLDDADALAQAVVQRLQDPALRAEEGRLARADAESRHDLAVQRARVLDLAASVAAGRRG